MKGVENGAGGGGLEGNLKAENMYSYRSTNILDKKGRSNLLIGAQDEVRGNTLSTVDAKNDFNSNDKAGGRQKEAGAAMTDL